MGRLVVERLRVSYDDVPAIADTSFEVPDGEFFCIVGPTNAGKSTLLKCIAGLVRAESGRVLLDGRDITVAEPRDRHLSLLFQNIALFPTMTGYENMAFAMRTKGVNEEAVQARVHELAALLKVGHLLDRLPRTFSGGEQQRVAIGRAIAERSEALLLDEPLTNLDARIRIQLRVQFKEIHQRTGQTLIYVTHDQIEAMSMSDRVAVLHQGRFQQIGTPDEVYHRPTNRFVAEFIGQHPMNLLPAEPSERDGVLGLDVRGRFFALPALGKLFSREMAPKSLAVGVRPEQVRLSEHRSSRTPHRAEILWVENLGHRSVVELDVDGLSLKAMAAADIDLEPKGVAWFDLEPKVEHLLDAGTDRFIR